ncbi:MAG: RNase P subunit p30 family protein [Candidatus Bathyarchaeia archaeon]
MRKFADLHLKPSLEDFEQVRSMIDKSAELGFRMVGLSLPPNVGIDEVNQVRKMCHDAGVELATRVDLAPRSRRELLVGLRKLRRRFEIVNVFCASKVVARQAAKDRRVDLLSFPFAEYPRVFFDRAEAELASSALACLEIEMQPLLSLRGFARVRLISILRREVAVAKSLKVPIVLSSGATDIWFLRKPQDFASLGMLFGLDLSLALDALSETPLKIVGRNRQKLSPDYVAHGVRVVRRRDCCLSV